MSAPGIVYFIRAGKDGPIKIGWTGGNPLVRLASLQTGNPEALTLLAWAPGSLEDERALHRWLAPHRLIGEWFWPSAELLGFVHGVSFARRERPAAAELETLPCGLSREDLMAISEFVRADILRVRLEAEHVGLSGAESEHEPADHRLTEEAFARALLLAEEADDFLASGGEGLELYGRDHLAELADDITRAAEDMKPRGVR